MNIKIIIILLLISNLSFGQEFCQIIGIESDDSEYSKGSYAVMYDSETKQRDQTKYVPLQTIAIYRKDDLIEIMSLEYLLIPTKKGFIYGTLEVIETKYDSLNDDYEIPNNTYDLSHSITKPIFFKSKEAINKFVSQQNPTFKDAIEIDFEKISFINSNFYITNGFESFVHGGASWFNAKEKINIYPLDRNGKLSNKISDYLDNNIKNEIVINTITNLKDYGFEEDINASSTLPWAGNINNHKDVYFDIDFNHAGLQITPLTLLQGNSSRSFLAKGEVLENQTMYDKLGITKYNKNITSDKNITFFSPDKTTKVEIFKNELIITDTKSEKVLKEIKINYNKVVMAEFATGNYAKKWKSQFE